MLHGQMRYGVASRFFQEIPEPLMRRINRVKTMSPRSGGYSSPVIHHSPPTSDSPWRVGQSVVHPSFGAGVIVNAEGRGADARVQVNFKKGGLKWLMLEYARLIAA